MGASDMTKSQISAVVILRLLIGWHFLYEGVLKIFTPSWTARGYLLSAEGPFEDFFIGLARDGLIETIDFLNIAGLIAIGLALVLGFMERPAALAGTVLLITYYLAHPPFMGLSQLGMEGNYWLVNKNLIEAAALLVVSVFPTAQVFGLELLLRRRKALTPKLQKHG